MLSSNMVCGFNKKIMQTFAQFSHLIFDFGLSPNKFNNYLYCKTIRNNSDVKIIILHSRSDELISIDHALSLNRDISVNDNTNQNSFCEIEGSHNCPIYNDTVDQLLNINKKIY